VSGHPVSRIWRAAIVAAIPFALIYALLFFASAAGQLPSKTARQALMIGLVAYLVGIIALMGILQRYSHRAWAWWIAGLYIVVPFAVMLAIFGLPAI
jgi:hypothetical protein